jgi:stress-induced morphogen
MAVKLRTKRPDETLKQVAQALKDYNQVSPNADIEAYRQNTVSIRIRIISPDFKRKSRVQREQEVWAFLDKLPEDAAAEISLLLLLTPDEAKTSFANFEFDNPIPTKL